MFRLAEVVRLISAGDRKPEKGIDGEGTGNQQDEQDGWR